MILMTDEMMELWKDGLVRGYRMGTGKELPADVILKLAEKKRDDCRTERKEVSGGQRNLVVKKPAYLDRS